MLLIVDIGEDLVEGLVQLAVDLVAQGIELGVDLENKFKSMTRLWLTLIIEICLVCYSCSIYV